jgi:hypothetical protein
MPQPNAISVVIWITLSSSLLGALRDLLDNQLVMTGYASEMRAGFGPPPYGRKIDVVIGSENTHAPPAKNDA